MDRRWLALRDSSDDRRRSLSKQSSSCRSSMAQKRRSSVDLQTYVVMGNCGTKPETIEGETPAPEQKAEEVVVESREIVVGEEEKESKVEGKVVEEASPTPSEPVKESTEATLEIKEVVATLSNTEEVVQTKEVVEAVVSEEGEKKKEEEEKK